MSILGTMVNGGLTVITVARAVWHLLIGAFLLFVTFGFAAAAFNERFWALAALWVGFHALRYVMSGLSAFTHQSHS